MHGNKWAALWLSLFVFDSTKCGAFVTPPTNYQIRQQKRRDTTRFVVFRQDSQIDTNEKEELMTRLPRHRTNEAVNEILSKTEMVLQKMHAIGEKTYDNTNEAGTGEMNNSDFDTSQDCVFANSYVDLGRVDTVGFDYDYTLVTYTSDLQELIYDMALDRLIKDKQYPSEMLDQGVMKFDPQFSIRGRFLTLNYFPCSIILQLVFRPTNYRFSSRSR